MIRSLLALSRLLLLGALLFQLPAARAQEAGRDYLALPTPQAVEPGNRVEVIEFFFYSCPYCAAIDPLAHPALRDDIGDLITQRPVPRPTWNRSIPSCS
jgi:thiol:disulfide interchange protein DsbA